MGLGISAYILINVDYNFLKKSNITQHELVSKIGIHKCVEEVSTLTGDSDIIVKVRVKDVDQLDKLVTFDFRAMEGVEKTKTSVILHESNI